MSIQLQKYKIIEMSLFTIKTTTAAKCMQGKHSRFSEWQSEEAHTHLSSPYTEQQW